MYTKLKLNNNESNVSKGEEKAVRKYFAQNLRQVVDATVNHLALVGE